MGAWDLDGLRDGYTALVGDLDRIGDRVADGAMGSAEALVVRTRLAARWIVLAGRDPRLPDALLPADWPLREARRRYVAVYDALGPLSELPRAAARGHPRRGRGAHPAPPPVRGHPLTIVLRDGFRDFSGFPCVADPIG